MFPSTVFMILLFSTWGLCIDNVTHVKGGTYRQLYLDSGQCRRCGIPSFCNLVILPSSNPKDSERFERADFYEELTEDNEDACRCDDMPNIYYSLYPATKKCEKRIDYCQKYKPNCKGYKCVEQPSTYYCSCALPKSFQISGALAGQDCAIDVTLFDKRNIYYPPGLVDLLNLPGKVHIEGYWFDPGMYIMISPNKEEPWMHYSYDGRHVTVRDKDMNKLPSPEALYGRLNKLRLRMPHAFTKLAVDWLNDQSEELTKGEKLLMHDIFIDRMVRIDLDAPDNVRPKNKAYKWRSIGRVAEFSLNIFSFPTQAQWYRTWNFRTLKTFVPYERHFLPCSYKITIRVRTIKCSDDIAKPTSIAIHRPLHLEAGREPWFDNGKGGTSCVMGVFDHRWSFLQTTASVPLDDRTSYKHRKEHLQLLTPKYSHGLKGYNKILGQESFQEHTYPESKLYLMIYDLVQKGHPDLHATGHEYQQRKLCFMKLTEDRDLKVYPVERKERVVCGSSYEIHMVNEDPASFPNEDVEVIWKCTYGGNKKCKSMNTTGTESYVTEKLVCNVTYEFNLTIYYWRNNTNHTLRTKNQVVFVSQVIATKIDIKCHGHCEHIISVGTTIKLSATEDPPTSRTWKWKVYSVEEGPEGLVTTEISDAEIAEGRNPETPDNVFAMRLTSAFEKDKYTIVAATDYGEKSYSIRVNQGPTVGNCSISPERGRMGEPMFAVICLDWNRGFLPFTFRVVEDYPLSSYPVYTSVDGVMENLMLFHENLSVVITDARQGTVQWKLPKIELELCDQVLPSDINEYLRRINVKLLGHEDEDALELLGELAREMTASETPYTDEWMLEMLAAIARVDNFEDASSVQRGLAVLNRITESKLVPNSLRTDEVLLGATEQFIRFSNIVSQNIDSGDYSDYDKAKLIPQMTEAASLILKRQDEVVVKDALEEDDNERHIQRAKDSTVAVMESMETLARSMTKDANDTLEPYKIDIGGLKLLVTVKNLSALNNDMKEEEGMSHTFKFLPETLKRHGEAQISLMKLSSENESVFWFSRDSSAGVMDIILKPTQNESFEIMKEPLNISLKMNDLNESYFEGVLSPTPPCPSRHRRDRSVSVHQLKLPDGEGAVIMMFPKDLVNKTKVLFQQGIRPDFNSVNNRTLLDNEIKTKKYKNLDSNTSDFYIGLIPGKNETVAKPFKFNLTIVRCAVWIGEKFEYRGCKFEWITASKKNSTLWCLCTHQSWFSSGFFLPPHKIVLTEDIQLFSTIFDNIYVPLLVFFILLFLAIVLLWGYRKDRNDVAERHIISMEDNYPGDSYPYVVAVFTGERFGSGTSSRVAIRIFGDKGHSRVHMLESSQRSVLQLGSDNWFMVKTHKSIGKLKSIELWHNNTGSRPEWYCRRVIVYDITAERSYEFLVERWFTFDASVPVDEARMFKGPVATDEEISRKWYYHITGWAFSELRDKHHWASIFTRHPRSLYTRCQRAIIAVGLLTTTMLISMMFFDINTTGPADLPAARFSFEDFWIGLKSTIISIVLTMAVLWCFQKSKQTEITEIRKLQEAKEGTEEKPKLKFKQKITTMVQKMATNKIKPEPIPYQAVTFGSEEPPKKKITVRLFLVLGWILSSVTLIAVSFFIILYGLKFGVKKSLVWILTFVSGTVSDTIIMEPLKMLIIAVIVSVLFKKSNIDNFTMKVKYTPEPETKETKLEKLRKHFQTRTMSHYHPCPTDWIKQHRKSSCRREVKYLCVYGIFYLLMLILVGIFLYVINIKVEFFYLRQLGYHFKETLHPDFEDSHNILTETSMYNFFHRSAIPALHRVLWYNNKSLPLEKGEKEPNSRKPRFTSDVKGYAQGYTSKLLGVPRLRQIRVRKGDIYSVAVDKLFRNFFPKAIGKYLPIREDRKSYLPTWKPYDKSLGNITQLWTYRKAYDTGTVFGKSLAPYGGGGYFRFLDWNLGGSLRELQYLQMNSWVDNYTRAVFLEINLYNDNLKLFSTVRLITEALPCGFFSYRTQLQTASFFFETKPESKAIVGLMFVLGILLIGYGLFCFIQFSRVGFFNYLGTFRGACDIILMAVGIASIANYLQRALQFALFIEYLDASPHDKYTSLHTPFQSDEVAHNAFGLFTMMLTVSMGVNIVQMISIGRFSWVFSKVSTLLVVTILLSSVVNVLLSFLSETIDRHIYNFFIFQFTFKHEKLGSFQADQNRWFFVICAPIAIGLLKFNLAAVIYFYNTLEKKQTTALAIVHGEKKIGANRSSAKSGKGRFTKKGPPNSDKPETSTLQKKIDKLLI